MTLGPNAALSFSTVFHELLEPFKYGAYPMTKGRRTICCVQRRQDDHLVSSWKEIGGPLVAEPRRIVFESLLTGSSLRACVELTIAYLSHGRELKPHMPLSTLIFQNDLAEIEKSARHRALPRNEEGQSFVDSLWRQPFCGSAVNIV